MKCFLLSLTVGLPVYRYPVLFLHHHHHHHAHRVAAALLRYLAESILRVHVPYLHSLYFLFFICWNLFWCLFLSSRVSRLVTSSQSNNSESHFQQDLTFLANTLTIIIDSRYAGHICCSGPIPRRTFPILHERN